jgi:S-(hydroxymethyl)mycothiol dehydrogenase
MSAVFEARGAVVRAPGAPALVETILLDAPGPGEVRVRIVASGVCHSDLHAKLGNFGTAFPYLLGHEATGVVDAVGPGVTRPEVGETVTLCWRAPCGACRFCTRGKAEYCARPLTAQPRMRTTDGLTLGTVLGTGSFCTHTVVAAAQALPMDKTLDPAATCLIGCAVTTGVGAALNAARVTPGSTVAVFGCGAIGVSVIQGARLSQAARIIAVDLVPRKLEWARSFGATDLVDASTVDPVKRIRELTNKNGVDFAFEAVGLPATVKQALAAVDFGGTCVVIGVPAPTAELSVSLARFFFGRANLRATFYGDCLPSRDFPLYADLYRTGALALDAMITERIGLDQIESAFEKMQRGETIRSVLML